MTFRPVVVTGGGACGGAPALRDGEYIHGAVIDPPYPLRIAQQPGRVRTDDVHVAQLRQPCSQSLHQGASVDMSW